MWPEASGSYTCQTPSSATGPEPPVAWDVGDPSCPVGEEAGSEKEALSADPANRASSAGPGAQGCGSSTPPHLCLDESCCGTDGIWNRVFH